MCGRCFHDSGWHLLLRQLESRERSRRNELGPRSDLPLDSTVGPSHRKMNISFQLEKFPLSLLALSPLRRWFVMTSGALAWGCCRSSSASGSYDGNVSHSGSSSGGYGNYSRSGSTTATGRYGNTYSASHSGSGYGGGGFHAAAVSGPDGGVYAAGVYRRRVW
jgi:hypothetical protein